MKKDDAFGEQNETHGFSIPPRSLGENTKLPERDLPNTNDGLISTVPATDEVGTVLYQDRGVFCNYDVDSEYFTYVMRDDCVRAISFIDEFVSSSNISVVAKGFTGEVPGNTLYPLYLIPGKCALGFALTNGATEADFVRENVIKGANAIINTCNRLGDYQLNNRLRVQLVTSEDAYRKAYEEEINVVRSSGLTSLRAINELVLLDDWD